VGPRPRRVVRWNRKSRNGQGDFGVNASYVWRRYDRFIWNDTNANGIQDAR
jgi:hypothetical protein